MDKAKQKVMALLDVSLEDYQDVTRDLISDYSVDMACAKLDAYTIQSLAYGCTSLLRIFHPDYKKDIEYLLQLRAALEAWETEIKAKDESTKKSKSSY